MFEARKSLDPEVHRIIGELQLHRFGSFLDTYSNRLRCFNSKLTNARDCRSSPVSLVDNPIEQVSLIDLAQSDNKLLSRILLSLGTICQEFDLLCEEAECDYYADLIVLRNELAENNKDAAALINKFTLKLQRICLFVDRSQQVIGLLLRQICAILGKSLYGSESASGFPEPLSCLAKLLASLIILDTLCENILEDHWKTYCKAAKSMLHNPAKFSTNPEDLYLLEMCLSNIGQKLLGGNILQQTLETCVKGKLIIAMKNSSLNNEFAVYINQVLAELEKDDENVLYTQMWLQVNAMFALNYACFGNIDKKAYKRWLDLNKKLSTFTIIGNTLWHSEKFLIQHIPILANSLDAKSTLNNRILLVIAKTQNLLKDAHVLYVEMCARLTELTFALNGDLTVLKVKQLQHYSSLIIAIVKGIKRASNIVKLLTNVHANEGRPMAKSTLVVLCKMIEVIKAAECILCKNVTQLVYVISLICQYMSHKALTILIRIKKSYTQDKSYEERQLDVLSSLNVTEQTLKGPNTRLRLLMAKLALSASGVPRDPLSEMRIAINHLEMMQNAQNFIGQLSNCSFLYWHKELLPVYFDKLVDTRVDLFGLHLLVNSLNDCTDILDGERCLEAYLKNNLTRPLNQLVETNLRLQTHLHLQLPAIDPFKAHPISSFSYILPVRFGNKHLYLKGEIEHYLSTTFYNLTTVILHDWRIYGEMRRLATLQFGLKTVQDNLPTQTLEQGIDVLEIMRNIHIFVGKYLYNLDNQLFVEDNSNNKHLNTIGITQIANSIRTHGIGIMNTTVNFTYQFLQNQFYIFSQFMYDEQIKSRLLKDLRFFAEHKVQLNRMYPFDRAEKFNFGIRKLGLNADGLSFLDLFRKLITHIGNAMGYIRMIRSGGRRCLAEATCFLPNLKSIENLTDLSRHLEETHFHQTTKRAAERLSLDINNLSENFEEATEYFKLLLNVFMSAFRNPKNVHLKNFYIIVPPLTINFVEHLCICKERLSKKNKGSAAFTDDGFAIGLAYIIELLDQSNELNSLHWFQSVQTRYVEAKKNLEQQKITTRKEDNKLQQTLALTKKRLDAFDKEFRLLYYNFNSARIFFQS